MVSAETKVSLITGIGAPSFVNRKCADAVPPSQLLQTRGGGGRGAVSLFIFLLFVLYFW